MATEFKQIQTEIEYKECLEKIKLADDVVNLCYSEMKKVSDLERITVFQNYINAVKISRNGYYKLVLFYEEQINPEINDKQFYTVRMGDTLALIAQAFYGKMEYQEYIYYYNNLEDVNLTPNQNLEIPEIHPSNPDVFARFQIDNLEAERIIAGDV